MFFYSESLDKLREQGLLGYLIPLLTLLTYLGHKLLAEDYSKIFGPSNIAIEIHKIKDKNTNYISEKGKNN